MSSLILELWRHSPTGNRYIVLIVHAVVQLAAGPLDGTGLWTAQQDETTIPWMPGLGDWVQAHRSEFQTVFPQGG